MPDINELFLPVLALFDTEYARPPFDIAVISKSLTVTNRMANAKRDFTFGIFKEN